MATNTYCAMHVREHAILSLLEFHGVLESILKLPFHKSQFRSRWNFNPKEQRHLLRTRQLRVL